MVDRELPVTDHPLPEQLTALVEQAAGGDQRAYDRLFASIYDELHALAHRQRVRWSGNETLNTTALVHEAYVKLLPREPQDWAGRDHFFAIAARAIRQVLVNYAERQTAQKRGGDAEVLVLDEARDAGTPAPFDDGTATELLALEAALRRLETTEERQARVVECRFFLGLPVQETARVLGISPATVKRDWRAASDWLHAEIGRAS